MSFEVEVKYRASGLAELVERLKALGAQEHPVLEQEDAYLNHPSRDFAQTNEALRIRRIGASNRVTYKGPRRDGPTKTREEIEIACTEGQEAFDQLLRLFTNLGFRPVAIVCKKRRPFHLTYQGRELEVALDTAEGLGEFVEVEAIAANESDLAAVQSAVLDLAQQLGLTAQEPRSYLRMALESRGPSA